MKHASDKKISKIEEQLEEVRRKTGITEKKPGAFYRKGRRFCTSTKTPRAPTPI